MFPCLPVYLLPYHCLFARARERMTVAMMFMVRTKASSTSAVPYWNCGGISGTAWK